jgi:hypothetical protein
MKVSTKSPPFQSAAGFRDVTGDDLDVSAVKTAPGGAQERDVYGWVLTS